MCFIMSNSFACINIRIHLNKKFMSFFLLKDFFLSLRNLFGTPSHLLAPALKTFSVCYIFLQKELRISLLKLKFCVIRWYAVAAT